MNAEDDGVGEYLLTITVDQSRSLFALIPDSGVGRVRANLYKVYIDNKESGAKFLAWCKANGVAVPK